VSLEHPERTIGHITGAGSTFQKNVLLRNFSNKNLSKSMQD
jgi:hypothetical protein